MHVAAPYMQAAAPYLPLYQKATEMMAPPSRHVLPRAPGPPPLASGSALSPLSYQKVTKMTALMSRNLTPGRYSCIDVRGEGWGHVVGVSICWLSGRALGWQHFIELGTRWVSVG